jgi:hypothetical protein
LLDRETRSVIRSNRVGASLTWLKHRRTTRRNARFLSDQICRPKFLPRRLLAAVAQVRADGALDGKRASQPSAGRTAGAAILSVEVDPELALSASTSAISITSPPTSTPLWR